MSLFTKFITSNNAFTQQEEKYYRTDRQAFNKKTRTLPYQLQNLE